jgi:hypothetical protein
MKIAKGWIVAAALLGAPDLAASQGYSPTVCAQRLQSRGLTPVILNPVAGIYPRMWCSGAGPYAPYQLSVCRNSRTGAIRQAPLSRLFSVCEALARKDPSWSPALAWTCCEEVD